jgi:hypothetical protein
MGVSMNSSAGMIATEADPTPLVLSLARTLRASIEVPELRELVAQTTGSVSLKSVTDGQSATLTFDGGSVQVARGLTEGVTHADLVFDPEYTVGETTDPVGQAAAKLLSPPLPTWREAARRFWESSRDLPGFPGRLVIACWDEEAQEVFGDGDDVYEIHGYGEAIAAVLSGQVDSFLIALAYGVVTAVGSAAHSSAVCGAHWKVRFGG